MVIAGEARGVELRTETKNGEREVSIRIEADGSDLRVSSGTIGGLLRQRDETVDPVIEQLDTFAQELIYEVNRVHSQGQGTRGWTSVTSTNAIENTSVALNALGSGIQFPVENGSFLVSITDQSDGSVQSYLIEVDPNSDSLSVLNSKISASIAPSGATSTLNPDGTFTIDAPSGQELAFSEDLQWFPRRAGNQHLLLRGPTAWTSESTRRSFQNPRFWHQDPTLQSDPTGRP